MRCAPALRIAAAFLAAFAFFPAAARAEHLEFDHRLYPPLYAAVQDGKDDAIFFARLSPTHLVDRIMVRGRSPQDWDEAVEIDVQRRAPKVSTAQIWYAAFRTSQDKTCPSIWREIAADAASLTFSRITGNCQAMSRQTRLYRIVLGKRDAFLLSALNRREFTPTEQEQVLQMLASARLVQ